ncbi:AlpA family transcriptional regulator [Saccharopolyspora sp. 6V]|uniref:helix-turn-helix transcriptional regulator n=1 Tax=Saccharopolyspora sp. 6V TaxID=2877239 RepID=UPI001CD27139|nr:helix-turn-helix domain-containing protein [Saccharopolyspora sp. 6V]MCA1191657.1 helix-turn-helix domain-containing protein [Saccharopolyspora sp. 6V]
MDSDKRFLTVREAARELGLSVMTLYRRINANQFPALRIGSRLVVEAAVIDRMAREAVRLGRVVDAADFVAKTAA